MGHASIDTSLFSLVESMQRELEELGLEREVIDAAVTRGLTAMLHRQRGGDDLLRRWGWPILSNRPA